MSPYIVFLIPIFAISIGMVAVIGNQFVRPWIALKERRMELEATMVAEKAAQYAAQTERLEQRVRVLERIITDRGVDLANEIESLRETPLN
ncbi:hypothetical protein DBR17_19615 [Sphingomonas sp. HMWF008]|nr:hypothetical protein DBR17_19615 [Sphingomonas sp. HMWF008]